MFLSEYSSAMMEEILLVSGLIFIAGILIELPFSYCIISSAEILSELREVMHLKEHGFAVDPKHPSRNRLNTALESALAIDEEVNE